MTQLQSKRYCSVEQLAGRFDISIRTVYRDIKALNEIDIPINLETGRGYFIAQGYFLPPLSLTIEEASALILLQALAAKFADSSVRKHSQNALVKLKAILRYTDKEGAEELSEKINVHLQEDERVETSWLTDIQQAIIAKTILDIHYTDTRGNGSKREIEPVGLVFYTNQWHLYAWCRTKKAYRDFKVKMITRLHDTRKPHSISNHQKIEDYVKIF